ncbi:MAG TPA: hypothetical protein VFY73_04035 [Ideonella sp.]|uniref:hypothetical protein n=1 Tax=Ideonella sp. TaxID=1929293 RepID=UPI002E36144B|nr:hypothetical protein [Ideonella sp.]HEX5683185.1 hypothetical protein [Ideonella sp.]
MPHPHRPSSCRPSALAAAFGLACASTAGAQAVDTGFSVGASSAWLVRGIPLSRGERPAVFAGADAYATSGWSLGGTVGRFEARDGEQADAVGLRAGYEHTFGGRWTLMTRLRHMSYPGSDALKAWCYNEWGASVADADRWVLSWSAETRRGVGCNQHVGPVIVSRSLELNGHWPLDGGFHLGAGLGRRMYGGGQGYLFGQAGGGWVSPGGLKLLLDRAWVSPQARLIYGHAARDRWVASVVQSF